MTDGRIIKREFDTGLPSGMSALVFNTRRPAFKDPRVRRAFILLFDAEWINRNLFNGLYKRTESFFERSYLSSHGRPADARERALLAPFADFVKPEVLEGTYRLPVTDDSRANLKAAHKLLLEAGYEIKGGRLMKAGRRLTFEFLAQTREQERLMLSYARTLDRLGIALRVRQVDSAQYNARLKSFDFDMVQWNWRASLSPGNEQINRWSSKAADIEGSLNLAGAKNPAADAMIEAMLQADTEEDFTAAVRAFDRVLISGDYVIPLFYLPKVWVALSQPPQVPIDLAAGRLRCGYVVVGAEVTSPDPRYRLPTRSRRHLRALGVPDLVLNLSKHDQFTLPPFDRLRTGLEAGGSRDRRIG